MEGDGYPASQSGELGTELDYSLQGRKESYFAGEDWEDQGFGWAGPVASLQDWVLNIN